MNIPIVTLANFEELAVKASVPLVLAIPNKQQASSSETLLNILQALSMHYGDKFVFGLLNPDASRLADQLGASSMAAILVLQNGRLKTRMDGVLPMTQYKRQLDDLLSSSENSKPQKKRRFLFF